MLFGAFRDIEERQAEIKLHKSPCIGTTGQWCVILLQSLSTLLWDRVLTEPGAHQLSRLSGLTRDHLSPLTGHTDVSHHTHHSHGYCRSKLMSLDLHIHNRQFTDGVISQTLLRDFCQERLGIFDEVLPMLHCFCPPVNMLQYIYTWVHADLSLHARGKSCSLMVNPSNMSLISSYCILIRFFF